MELRRRTSAVIALAVAMTMFTGVAVAATGFFNSASMERRVVRTDDVASVHSGMVYANVPNAATTVSVPAGRTRLLTARFTAESLCTGPVNTYCSVQIVARRNATGAVTQMYPQAGADFAFDTASSDGWESNSVARTLRVGSGSHTIFVQRRVTHPDTTARHDDWTFEVDVNR